MPDSSYQKGVSGEAAALAYLKDKGMVPLEARYHSPFGEIDLVMLDGDALVFVEVKARPSGARGDGAAAVTFVKRRRLMKTALCYLRDHPSERVARFDVVELTKSGVDHIENAFDYLPLSL